MCTLLEVELSIYQGWTEGSLEEGNVDIKNTLNII